MKASCLTGLLEHRPVALLRSLVVVGVCLRGVMMSTNIRAGPVPGRFIFATGLLTLPFRALTLRDRGSILLNLLLQAVANSFLLVTLDAGSPKAEGKADKGVHPLAGHGRYKTQATHLQASQLLTKSAFLHLSTPLHLLQVLFKTSLCGFVPSAEE